MQYLFGSVISLSQTLITHIFGVGRTHTVAAVDLCAVCTRHKIAPSYSFSNSRRITDNKKPREHSVCCHYLHTQIDLITAMKFLLFGLFFTCSFIFGGTRLGQIGQITLFMFVAIHFDCRSNKYLDKKTRTHRHNWACTYKYLQMVTNKHYKISSSTTVS